MKTTFPQKHVMDLDESGEWVEVPIEKILPQHLLDAYSDEDEEMDAAIVIPYLYNEFKKWLMEERYLSEKCAENYLRAYESGYESLYEKYRFDLYDALQYCLSKDSDKTPDAICKENAPEYVKIYVDVMQEELLEDEDAYTKAELLAMLAYHAFIVDVAGTSDKKLIKEKARSLPDEEEFLSWVETEYRIDYDNALKIVSSVKRMDLILPSLVTEPMTFLDVLRALPAVDKRKNYLKMIRTKKKGISRKTTLSEKTISNGLSNIRFYVNFLNSRK